MTGLGVADQKVNRVWSGELWSAELPCGLVMTRSALFEPLWPAEAQCETRPISGSDRHVVFLEFGIMRPYELFQQAHTRSDFMHAWGSNQSFLLVLIFPPQSFLNEKKEGVSGELWFTLKVHFPRCSKSNLITASRHAERLGKILSVLFFCC